jgi:hypothetical protein
MLEARALTTRYYFPPKNEDVFNSGKTKPGHMKVTASFQEFAVLITSFTARKISIRLPASTAIKKTKHHRGCPPR